MTHMRKYFYLFLLSLILTFSACTRRDTVSDEGVVSDGTAPEIVVYNLFDPPDAFAGQIQAFKSQFGVNVRYVSFNDPEQYEDDLINELAEGKGPDVFTIHNSWILKHLGKLAPMPVNLAVPMTAEKYDQTFFHVATEDLVIDNRIYGIPLSIDTLALYYNEEYLVNAVPGTNRPGRTWEEIKKNVIALTKTDNSPERFGVSGIALGRADNISNATDILQLMMMQHETKFYDQNTKRAVFAERQGVIEGKPYYPGIEALNLYSSFGLPTYNNYTWNKALTGLSPDEQELNPFVRGKVAMILGYSSRYEQLKKAILDQQKIGGKYIDIEEVKIIEAPQLLDPLSSNKLFSYASYWPLVVSKNSQHSDAAWSFVQYMSSKESLDEYFKKTKRPTSRLDMQADQSLDPIYGAFARQAQYAHSLKMIDASFYQKVFFQAIQSVVETKAVNKTLELAQKQINCLIDAKGQSKGKVLISDCLKTQ